MERYKIVNEMTYDEALKELDEPAGNHDYGTKMM